MKKLIVFAVAMLFVVPAAFADVEMTTIDSVMTTPPCKIVTVDPAGAGTYDAIEGEEYASGTGPDSAYTGDVWIVVENWYYWANMKHLTVILTGAGTATINAATVTGYLNGGTAVGVANVEVVGGVIVADIFPQPDWEVIHINGDFTIETVTTVAVCTLIPSMTHYGLGILALLLIGSTVWVLRRRRRVGSVA